MCQASPLRRLARACAALAVAAAALAAAPASAQLTVGNGTDPVNPAPMCPGDGPAVVDAFTLDATPADTVNQLGIQLSPVGASQLIRQVDITADDGVTVVASAVPVGDSVVFNLLKSPLRVTTLKGYKIRVTPKAHAQMPAAPGSALGVKATVRSASSFLQIRYLNDTSSATVTLDNQAPSEITWTNVVPNRLPGAPTPRIQLSWATSDNVVVLRRMGAPVTETLTDGQLYSVGAPTFGATATSTQIVAVGPAAGLDDTTGLANGKAFYYKVFVKDPCGNYSVGSSVGPVVPGSTTEGALAGTGPVVGLLNPSPGPVSVPFRVQARVFSPKSGGGAAQPVESNVFLVVSDGTTTAEVQLVRNPNYGGDVESGIFEIGPLGAYNVSPGLTPKNLSGFSGDTGRYTLQVKASNDGRATWVYSAIVGVSVNGIKGDGNLLVRDNSSQLCADCHNLQTHSSEATGTGKGSWYVGCRTCHTPHGTTNASLVAELVQPPGVNGQQPPSKIVFSTKDGYSTTDPAADPASASFANAGVGSERRTGICQACHTRTTHYRFDGTDTSGSGTHYTSNCMACHKHEGGMKISGGTCTNCHGDVNRGSFSVAPPKDTCGNTGTSGGTGINRVGAHQKHLVGGSFTRGVACTQCHVEVPARPGHPGQLCADGTNRAVLTWGSRATASGTLVPQWNPATQACSNTYCHGQFTNSGKEGVATQATWGGTVACGDCHGSPPLTNHAAGDTACADCHPAGYAQNSVTGGALDFHMDGKVDTSGTGCTMCHGDKNRDPLLGTSPLETVDDRFKSAPPKNPTSASNWPYPPEGSQAHQKHTYSNTISQPLVCDDCHTPTPTGSHKNGTTDLGWSALARGPSPTVNYSPSPSFTCQASYCHGDTWTVAGPIRGKLPIPVWTTIDGTYKACDACHKSAPTDPVHTTLFSRAGVANSPATDCNKCHPDTVLASGAIDIAKGNHVNGSVQLGAGVGCTSCHASPPVNVGTVAAPGVANANNANGVGAHGSHSVALSMTTRTAAFACTACHPSVVGGNLHADGTVQTLSSVAWAAGPANCGANWCHGSTAAQSGWGGARTTPLWNDATDNYRACTACHGAPPPLATSGHPQNATCTDCHLSGTGAGALSGQAKDAHVNFQVDTLRSGCNACHGDFSAVGVIGNTGTGADRAAAPGFNATSEDTLGNTLASAPAVGAHGKHLTATAIKQTNGGFAAVCQDCHNVLPGLGDKSHATGTNALGQGSRGTVDFSNFSKTGGLSALYQNSTTGTTTPGAAGTCANVYCHGGKWANDTTGKKGTNVSPSWTGGQMNCGSCHASPPTDSNHKTVISGAKSCQSCHPGAYVCTVTVAGNYSACTAVDATRHIDGLVNTVIASCTSCHGQPPVQALGNTADPAYGTTGYGAHDPHVNATTLRSAKLTCTDCHGSPAVTSVTHSDGNIDSGWSNLASSGVTVSPVAGTFTAAWATTANCTNACHSPGGASMGGSRRNPSWTGGPSHAACGTCHGAPPPNDATATADHPQNVACANCHGAGFATGGLTGNAKNVHMNQSTVGGRDKPYNGCTACHGALAGVSGTSVNDPLSVAAAPGWLGTTAVSYDTTGASTTTAARVGAHDAHVRPSGSLNSSAPIACTACHPSVAAFDTGHADSTIALSWVGLASSTGITAAPTSVTGSESTLNCTNYCHSNAGPTGGLKQTANPNWTNNVNMTCTSCHAITAPNPANVNSPLLSHSHWVHITTVASGGYFFNCSQCHYRVGTGQSDGTGLAITNPANHVTGVHNVDFNPTFATTTNTSYASQTCSNTYCHSNGTSTSSPSTNSIAWTATTTCATCHGLTVADPAVVGSATQKGGSQAHLFHVANPNRLGGAAGNYKCSDCHRTTVSSATNTDATIISTTLHVNKVKDVSIANRGSRTSSDTTATCATTWCHSSGQVYPSAPHYEPVGWTSVWSGSICNKCHGAFTAGDAAFGFTASVYGEPNYVNSGAGTIQANSHGKHVASYGCYVCHSGMVTPVGTNLIATGQHTDGQVQVVLSTTVAGVGAAYTPGSGVAGSCAASACHGSGRPVWGGNPLGCDDCHLSTAADHDSFAFGDPAVINSTEWASYGHGKATVALPTPTTGSPCLYCHDNGIDHDQSLNPFRLRGRSTGTGATFDAYAAGTLANYVCLNCHGTGSLGVDPADGGSFGTNPNVNGATKVSAYHGGSKHLGVNNGGTRCWDCHDPHGDLTNVKMVSKTLVQNSNDQHSFSATRVGLPGNIVFTGGTTGTDYAGTASKVCNACHTTTAHYRSDGSLGGHNLGAKCTVCHNHSPTPTTAFTQTTACNGCHGAPPTAGKHSAHDQSALFTETAYGNRDRHASATEYGYACNTCHNGTHWDSDNAYTVQVVFSAFDVTTVVTISTGTYTRVGGQLTDTFSNAEGSLDYRYYSGTCSVYCHTNASPVGTNRTLSTSSPAWNETTWTANEKCVKCHAMTAADPATASSTLSTGHRIHIMTGAGQYGYTCQTCHNGVATGASNYPTTAGAITDKRLHVNGSHTVIFDAFNPTSSSYSSGGQTCANTYCHSNGTNTTAGNTSIGWTVSKSCAVCHGGTALDAAVVGSATQKGGSATHLAHVKNAAFLGANYKCGDCHQTVVQAGTDATLISTALHVNKVRNVSIANRGSFPSTDTTTTCSATYCHSSGQASASYRTITWSSGAIGCNGCHGTTNNVGFPDFGPANSHSAHVTGATDADKAATCRSCHAGLVIDPGTAISGARHTDGLRDVAILNTLDKNGATSNYDGGTKTCNSISCHGSGTPVWGGPAMDCSGCHLKGTGIAVNDGVDDYVYGNGTMAMIDAENWNSWGHGRLASMPNYPQSGNAPAAFDTGFAVSTDDGCKYCHNKAIGHDTTNSGTNPFRLANVGAADTIALKIGVCTTCHGGAGYLGKTAGKAIDAYHFGPDHANTSVSGGFGGQLCWDCHNPHGDYNYGSGEQLAYMMREQPVRTHADASFDARIWGTATNAMRAPAPRFTKELGGNTTQFDYADYVITLTSTAGTFRGICQVCHTSPTNVTYAQTKYDTSHNPGNRCTMCHTHDQAPNLAFKGNGDCVQCHNVEKQIGTSGVYRRAVVLEFARTWSHKRSAAGAVTKYDCIPCHMEAAPTTADMDQTYHGNKIVNLRDPDTGGHIKQATFNPSTQNAGSWTTSSLDATFSRWSRNMSQTLDVDAAGTVIKSVMTQQCLHCHDKNGAASPNAQVPGGSAGKPFATNITRPGFTAPDPVYSGTSGRTACKTDAWSASVTYDVGQFATQGGTIYRSIAAANLNHVPPNATWWATATAAEYTGCVTDVDKAFAVTNSSYHPVKGSQNNWYAKTTRMMVPWALGGRASTVNTTTWGPLISCWDCHALPTDRGTTNGTVTAHGAASTVRASPTATGNTPTLGSANESALCKLCHRSYDNCGGSGCATNQGHMAGSAFNTNTGRSEKQPFLEAGCNACHASGYSVAVSRPIRGEDVHGFDALYQTTPSMNRWATGADKRPYAFIRNNQTGTLGVFLRNHQPARGLNGTTYTPSCNMSSTGTCSRSSVETYTPGGTY